MPVNSKEMICLHNLPTPAAVAGSRRKFYLVTNDDAATVEADGYLDGVFNNGLQKGDIIEASLDNDGTATGKLYIVTAGGADVAIAEFTFT